jgi:hypothetical protein
VRVAAAGGGGVRVAAARGGGADIERCGGGCGAAAADGRSTLLVAVRSGVPAPALGERRSTVVPEFPRGDPAARVAVDDAPSARGTVPERGRSTAVGAGSLRTGGGVFVWAIATGDAAGVAVVRPAERF